MGGGGVAKAPDIDSAINMKLENDVLTFLYDKSAEELIRALGSVRFSDVNITDPDLEEIFMHFYSREEK